MSAQAIEATVPPHKTRPLRRIPTDSLPIERRRRGREGAYKFDYLLGGKKIADAQTIDRLNALAVPPAYTDVRYADDPQAHIQAIGRDAAGRLQYRYHADWEKVREARKAKHLERLAKVFPRLRRSFAQHLKSDAATRAFACAALIELIAASGIRPGSEEYLQRYGSRGAATLLKSDVRVSGQRISLSFNAKGGKAFVKEVRSQRLARAIGVLRSVPGDRLFQFRGDDGQARIVTARDANDFLRDTAGVKISLKDFRTLCASARVLRRLARAKPEEKPQARRKQVLEAVKEAAEELGNTPTICRKSYIPGAIIEAFERGELDKLVPQKEVAGAERIVAKIVAKQ